MAYAMEDELSAEALAAAPLVFNYYLTPGIDFQTTVTGANRDTATVTIYYINTPMWTGTLTPGQPTLAFPTLSLGDLTLSDGEVTLTPPTATTDGFVLLACTLKRRKQQPVEFSGIIAKWPLSSTGP